MNFKIIKLIFHYFQIQQKQFIITAIVIKRHCHQIHMLWIYWVFRLILMSRQLILAVVEWRGRLDMKKNIMK